jgi:hypothetical protein
MRRFLARTALALGLLIAVIAPAFAATTWNSSDCDSSFVLSNGNDTATQGSVANTWRSCRGTTSKLGGSAGKIIFSVTATSPDPGNSGWMAGVADASNALTTNIGGTPTDANSLGLQPVPGRGYQGGATIGASCNLDGGTWGTGSTLWIAIDFNTGHVWCDNTSAFPSVYSPASGLNWTFTLGTGYSGVAFYPGFSGYDSGGSANVGTLNTNPSLTGATNISGFCTWDNSANCATAAGAALLHGPW